MSSNAQIVISYFEGKGFTHEQACAIAGNLQAESHLSIDPSAYNPAAGGQGARGIAQWRGSRITDFRNLYHKDILQATLQEQLDFMMWEFNGNEAKAYRAIKSATSVREAAILYEKTFARSDKQALEQRIRYSERLYGGQFPPAPLTSGSTGSNLSPPKSDPNLPPQPDPMPAPFTGDTGVPNDLLISGEGPIESEPLLIDGRVQNPLEKMVSYNCIFTLSCISPEQTGDPSSYQNGDYGRIVVRSGGSRTAGSS